MNAGIDQSDSEYLFGQLHPHHRRHRSEDGCCLTMSSRSLFLLRSTNRLLAKNDIVRHQLRVLPRTFSTATTEASGLPDSIKRVGTAEAFPNEYPGQNYAFNWCLNGDGVTPLRKSAFRISKPLDLKIAGLSPPKTIPLQVKAAAASKMPEAGSDKLSFDQFDQASQRSRDLLSLADRLYCPEGHAPGSRTGVRVITNSATLAPNLLAYLERAPRKDPPESLPVTVYVLEGAEEDFAGYAVEEIEVRVESGEAPMWVTGEEPEPELEAKSVAAVVVVAPKPDIKVVVAGIEASQKALAADEKERESKKAAEDAANKE